MAEITESVQTLSTYEPPSIAVAVGNILRAPRTIRHHGNFSLVFSSDYDDQRDYVDGILVVETVFLIVFVLWAFVVLVLKFKGREVGCASGRAFVLPEDDEENDQEDKEHTEYESDDYINATRTTVRNSYRTDESIPSDEYLETTSESSGENHPFSHWEESSSVGSGDDDNPDEQLLNGTSPRSSTASIEGNVNGDANNSGFHKSTDKTKSGPDKTTTRKKQRQNQHQVVENVPNGNQQPPHTKTNKREFRTRACFLFFATIALACIPLILVFSFGPMKDATHESDEITLTVKGISDQINNFLKSIEVASVNALDIVSITPTDLRKICPEVDETDLEAVLGIDLMDIINSVSDEYERLKEEMSSQLETGYLVVRQVQDGLSTFEVSVDETEEFLWIIPGLLFGIGILTAISILGVILAWKDQSGSRFQFTMSWVILPLLCMSMLACWGLVMAYSLGAMVGTDACTSSSSIGSPDRTIQEIMSLQQLDQNSTLYQLVNGYTNKCRGQDPTQQIQDVEEEIQGQIDTIWRQMSKLDSLGRDDVMKLCGGKTEAFTNLVSGARNLARLLTGIRRSLDGMEQSLKCTTINPIYVQTAHQVVCTETLTSSVYGFIFFLILSLCVMGMISLRSSWLHHIQEEKVYHDEDDIAENMFLDEHEEYLAYISRYKHEWQEYGGFENEASAIGSPDDCYQDESCYDDEIQGSASDDSHESIASDIDVKSSIDEDGIAAAAAAGAAAASLASEDISPFSSFDQKSMDGSIQCAKERLAVPPSLLERRPMHAYAVEAKRKQGEEPDGIILATVIPATPVQSFPAHLLMTPNHPLARRSLSQIRRTQTFTTSVTAEPSGEVECVSEFQPGFRFEL